MLASRGSDNKLLVWSAQQNTPVLRFTDHKAAMKTLRGRLTSMACSLLVAVPSSLHPFLEYSNWIPAPVLRYQVSSLQFAVVKHASSS